MLTKMVSDENGVAAGVSYQYNVDDPQIGYTSNGVTASCEEYPELYDILDAYMTAMGK